MIGVRIRDITKLFKNLNLVFLPKNATTIAEYKYIGIINSLINMISHSFSSFQICAVEFSQCQQK